MQVDPAHVYINEQRPNSPKMLSKLIFWYVCQAKHYPVTTNSLGYINNIVEQINLKTD